MSTEQGKAECLRTVQHLGTDSHCEWGCGPRAISPQTACLFSVCENKMGTVSPSSIPSDFPLPFLLHPLFFLPYPLHFSCLLPTPFVCSLDLVSFFFFYAVSILSLRGIDSPILCLSQEKYCFVQSNKSCSVPHHLPCYLPFFTSHSWQQS